MESEQISRNNKNNNIRICKALQIKQQPNNIIKPENTSDSQAKSKPYCKHLINIYKNYSNSF